MNRLRRSGSLLALAALLGALCPVALVAQEPAPPAPTTVEAASPAEAPPAPAKPAKDKHHLQIEIGGTNLDPTLREKLSPEQLLQLELAKRQQSGSLAGLEDYLVPILVPLGFFLMIFGIIAITLWSRMRQRRLMHETIRMLVEKGQPVPPELFTPAEKPRSALRRGLSNIGIGLGLILFFLGVERSAWGIGCVPLFLGLGQLLAWKLEQPKPGAPPPVA